MKYLGPPLFSFFFLIAISPARPQLTLIENGLTDYRIILSWQPAPQEERAARIFNEYFEKITGTRLEILTDQDELSGHEILIGNSSRIGHLKIKTKLDKTGPEGFRILTEDERLVILGGSPDGTLNGVYSFLEEHLGCRMYTSDVILVPIRKSIRLPEISEIHKPVFTYRETHFPGRFDPRYREWHKLHSHNSGSWGMWVHTFDDLVPPSTYFKDHPEYFSEINGKRVPDGQLCLTNPEVFQVLVENLARKIRKEPEAIYWSVSQNDNYLACQCSQCKDAVEEYGSESGLMIRFVNSVAAQFPDRTISTLAYQYTRSAPKGVKPLPNVNIMLCSIECNRSKPLATDPTSAAFVEDVRGWSKLTDNILIWDYVVQFRNYISPFPNLKVLQPNLEFFADEECRMMFQQGSGGALSEFSELRSYLIAKLLWDPGQDEKEVVSDFMYGYYGDAAPYLLEYIEMMHDELDASGDDLWIYGFPYDGIDTYLEPLLIREYIRLFDMAEKAVGDNPRVLKRVKTARLPLDFAIMDISLHRVNDELAWLVRENGAFKPNNDLVRLLDDFVDRCDSAGIEILNEQGLKPDEYRQKINEYLNRNSFESLGTGKKAILLTDFSPKYEAGGATALTDGLRGTDDYHFNWLGFEGNDLEAIIDLEKETTISEVSADFLQNIKSWIFLPSSFEVEYATADGVYIPVGKDVNITPEDKTESFIQSFKISFQPVAAKFVKVKANALKTCPEWHVGKDKKSWIFVDEVIIK